VAWVNDLDITVEQALGAETSAAIDALIHRVGERIGRQALSEHKRIELDHLAGNGIAEGGTPAGRGIVARRPGSAEVVGYAQLSSDPGDRFDAVELVVDSSPASDQVSDALLESAISVSTAGDAGSLRLWVSHATPGDDARAVRHGFTIERHLLQLRCPLPLPPTGSDGSSEPALVTRPFRPGGDETAWLTVNNRAFATHPEQGNWDLSTLLEREAEPWFDAHGLLLLEVDGRLAGSCWTKVHADTDPPMGEIYVIGVDPDFRGRGWGRGLTAAGLEWLAQQGLGVGMLYVDGDNLPAVSLYRSMGFTDHHVDRAYLRARLPWPGWSAGADEVADPKGDGRRPSGDQQLPTG